MFKKEVYINRREKLQKGVESGVILILGNKESSMNYPDNTYHFRQDSNFLYFFGLDYANLAGVIDVENNKQIIFGDDYSIDDIIWMGDQPSMKELGSQVGIADTRPFAELEKYIQQEKAKGRPIHILPPYRGIHTIQLGNIIGVPQSEVPNFVSEKLIKEVIKLRSVKEDVEIEEINLAVDIAYKMHTTSMKMAMPGVIEREIAGTVEGISLANGGPVSFPVILSIHGETLHNHYHGNILKEGRMMVTDAGAEMPSHYASDITRTVPVGGKFNQRQKSIYEIVLKAQVESIKNTKPGITNRQLHLDAVTIIANGLKELGIMKGDIKEAVSQGAHAIFMPHGLGHMMGLDVHDMEGLGENLVGYGDEMERSTQFGLSGLRLGRTLRKGFVFTIEPGCYFIPKLIDKWRAEKKFTDFLNYDELEKYKDFGGIRIEDDILVTDDGYRVLGNKPIPKTVKEIEETMSEGR